MVRCVGDVKIMSGVDVTASGGLTCKLEYQQKSRQTHLDTKLNIMIPRLLRVLKHHDQHDP